MSSNEEINREKEIEKISSVFNPNVCFDTYFIKEKKDKYPEVIHCKDCIYAEKQEGLPAGYIHCTRLPNMISDEYKGCKGGKKK